MALLTTVPPSMAVCCFVFIPESPRWLLARGKERKAKEVLRQIAERNGVVLGDITIVPEEEVCVRVCILIVYSGW